MKDIKIIVATHKKYQMPEDKMYMPLHVGAEGKEDLEYAKDNEGQNISENKNTNLEPAIRADFSKSIMPRFAPSS